MKKTSDIVIHEIEQDHENFSTLFDISKELDYDSNFPLELELEVHFNYHIDKGRTYGEPENCYPPEFDFEVNTIYCNGIEVIELLHDGEIEKISQEIKESI